MQRMKLSLEIIRIYIVKNGDSEKTVGKNALYPPKLK